MIASGPEGLPATWHPDREYLVALSIGDTLLLTMELHRASAHEEVSYGHSAFIRARESERWRELEVTGASTLSSGRFEALGAGDAVMPLRGKSSIRLEGGSRLVITGAFGGARVSSFRLTYPDGGTKVVTCHAEIAAAVIGAVVPPVPQVAAIGEDGRPLRLAMPFDLA